MIPGHEVQRIHPGIVRAAKSLVLLWGLCKICYCGAKIRDCRQWTWKHEKEDYRYLLLKIMYEPQTPSPAVSGCWHKTYLLIRIFRELNEGRQYLSDGLGVKRY